MKTRLIFSDIDHTILPGGGHVSDYTVDAVRRCRESGVEFVLASGRWYPAAKLISEGELGIRDGYIIICNGGAVVRSDGTPLQEWGMTPEQAAAVHALMKDENTMITCYVRDAIYRIHSSYLSVFKLPETSYYNGDQAYDIVDEDEEAFLNSFQRHPYKMEAYSDDYELLARLRTQLTQMGLQVNSSYPFNLEIMAPGTGKGAAVRWLTRHLGFTREQTMGFGDYTNDLPMLAEVGCPVAVANAHPEVKAVCSMIVPACEDDGVAKTIWKYVLGDERP